MNKVTTQKFIQTVEDALRTTSKNETYLDLLDFLCNSEVPPFPDGLGQEDATKLYALTRESLELVRKLSVCVLVSMGDTRAEEALKHTVPLRMRASKLAINRR